MRPYTQYTYRFEGGPFMHLINIGFGNLVAAERVVALISPESSPIKRVIQEARERGNLIDASFGRKTKTVLITDSGHVILSALPAETLGGRLDGQDANTPPGPMGSSGPTDVDVGRDDPSPPPRL